MKIDVFNTQGKKVGKIDLPKEIFLVKVNEKLLAQAVRVFLFNQRQGTVSTKTRGEVKGSSRKIYAQKGTGRARHGDRYAPIFVGGGRAHGPKPKDWSRKLPKKMKRQALFSALSLKVKEKKILVLQGLEKIVPKTKKMVKVLENLKLQVRRGKLLEKTLLVLPEKMEEIIRAGKNIANLKIALASNLNTYQVLNYERLIFLKKSIKVLESVFLKKELSEK